MAQKREFRQKISMMPWRGGLMTAGQQTTIPENMLWQAANTTAALDGMREKRPGLRQWGQTLKVPDVDAADSTLTAFNDFLSGTGGFVETDSDPGTISTSTNEGALRTNVQAGSSNENLLLSYAVGTLSSNTKWAMRFMFRGTNLPAYTPADTVPNTFAVRAQGAAGTVKEFAIWSGGIYWKKDSDSQYTLVTDSENAGAGGWNAIEIRVDDNAGDTTVYLNDTLLQTLTSADLKDVSVTGTSAYEFRWEVEGTGSAGTQYSTQLSTVMYNDTDDDPFIARSIIGLTDFQYITKSGSQRRALLCAVGNYIYHDNGLSGAWRPLHPKQHANVFFFPYRRTMVWVDNNGSKSSSMWQWDGRAEPDLQDKAPILQFGTEHRLRVLAAGDSQNPLRVYYCGDRQLNVWFSPSALNTDDQFDVLLNAGYIEIASKKGDEVTNIWGDFYGIAIIFTRRGIWQLSGQGLNSFDVQNITQDVGCENPRCAAQVGNDLWFVSRQGVHSLAVTSKFGDIQTQFASSPIQDLWGSDPDTVTTINREYLSEARLDYNPQSGLIYLAVPLVGEQFAENSYVFNINTKEWYGPWTVESVSLKNVEIATPVLEVMMHGDSAGRIGYAEPTSKADFSTGSYTMTVESPYLDGRSIDEKIKGMTKVWKLLRIFILPRGKYDFTVTWFTDASESHGPMTIEQLQYKQYVLGDTEADPGDGDFRLDLDPDGILRSSEEISIVEIPLDDSGKTLAFTLEQSGLAEDLVIQGFEVEFTVSGYEVE